MRWYLFYIESQVFIRSLKGNKVAFFNCVPYVLQYWGDSIEYPISVNRVATLELYLELCEIKKQMVSLKIKSSAKALHCIDFCSTWSWYTVWCSPNLNGRKLVGKKFWQACLGDKAGPVACK